MNEQFFSQELLTIHTALRMSASAVGLVFLYAVAAKLLDISSFLSGIRGYQAIPSRFAHIVAAVVIACEALIGLAHITASALLLVVPATVALLLAFLIWGANVVSTGQERQCLCFGANHNEFVDKYSLVRTALLLLAELILLSHLLLNDGSIAMSNGDVYANLGILAIAGSIVTLVMWGLALPQLYRAIQIVRT